MLWCTTKWRASSSFMAICSVFLPGMCSVLLLCLENCSLLPSFHLMLSSTEPYHPFHKHNPHSDILNERTHIFFFHNNTGQGCFCRRWQGQIRKMGRGLFSGLLNLAEGTIGLKWILIKSNTSGVVLLQAIDPGDNGDLVSICSGLYLHVNRYHNLQPFIWP